MMPSLSQPINPGPPLAAHLLCFLLVFPVWNGAPQHPSVGTGFWAAGRTRSLFLLHFLLPFVEVKTTQVVTIPSLKRQPHKDAFEPGLCGSVASVQVKYSSRNWLKDSLVNLAAPLQHLEKSVWGSSVHFMVAAWRRMNNRSIYTKVFRPGMKMLKRQTPFFCSNLIGLSYLADHVSFSLQAWNGVLQMFAPTL